MTPGRACCAAGAAALCVLGLPAAAPAQGYPTRPITLIVPYTAGGTTSTVSRLLADKMSETLGQPIVIENRGGAGGTIGTRAVARSAPDGYTIGLANSGTIGSSPIFYANAGFDPRKDFAPIGLIGNVANTLVVHPALPVKSMAELIAYAKANPGKISYGSPGSGTATHVAGEYLAHAAGITLTHVPYKGTGPAMADLLGGHIVMAIVPVSLIYGYVAEGRLRALAVVGTKRSSLLPDVPTVAETVLPGFEASLHYGFIAPAGTPRAIVDRLNKELRAALATADVRKALIVDGAEPTPSTPEEYAAHIDRELTKWSEVIKASGIRAE